MSSPITSPVLIADHEPGFAPANASRFGRDVASFSATTAGSGYSFSLRRYGAPGAIVN